MFGYKCECGRGTVQPRNFKQYKTVIDGKTIVVPEATVGVCDVCGVSSYSAQEYKRWRELARASRRKTPRPKKGT